MSDIRKGGAAGAERMMSQANSSTSFNKKRMEKLCLLDIFTCKTMMGARSLRNSLLQPYNDIDTLQSRLDMVELLLTEGKRKNQKMSEFIHTTDFDQHLTLCDCDMSFLLVCFHFLEESFYSLNDLLPMFSDLDSLSASAVQLPAETNIKATQKQVNIILALGNSLNLLPKLQSCVSHLRLISSQRVSRDRNTTDSSSQSDTNVSSLSSVLSQLESNLSQNRYEELQHDILSIIDLHKSGLLHKSHQQYARYKFIFAVKSGLDGLLDVSRRTFLEAVDGELKKRVKNKIKSCVYVTHLICTLFSYSFVLELEREHARLVELFHFPAESTRSLLLTFTAARGYHLSIPTEALHKIPIMKHKYLYKDKIKEREHYVLLNNYYHLMQDKQKHIKKLHSCAISKKISKNKKVNRTIMS
jgi:DNA mismatch repair ATPase MutS